MKIRKTKSAKSVLLDVSLVKTREAVTNALKACSKSKTPDQMSRDVAAHLNTIKLTLASAAPNRASSVIVGNAPNAPPTFSQ
jgi:hypothetical protein